MARPLRIEYSGAVYHVTSRGNEKKPIFKNDEDRRIFLDILTKVNRRFNWLCHAYVLMNNHYHIVIETPEGNLSKGMRQLNGIYTQTFNKRHKRTGHIFQGRYKAILIQKESHLLEVCRYVVLNPVRARATESLGKWKWSSYRATADLAGPHPCLTTDWILAQFGTKVSLAKEQYRQFVREGFKTEPMWEKVKGQILFGENDFAERFISYLKGHTDTKEIPRIQRYITRPPLDDLFKKDKVKDRRERDRKIKEAVEEYGYDQKVVADYLTMHYSTISRIMGKEEKSKVKT